ncbi:MAG: LLM class flavin-dependent oxidoreductase [Spirochaetaceae bacterium]|nr:LLM class flavin-dependent oxidoreductase [Spirochaetaceae bacterium]
MKISIADQTMIRTGGSAKQALEETVKLARFADERGFERFWLTEHHNMPFIGSSTPEILIGKVAEQTERIRVGAGGIMLPNHSALKVAECFRLLEALYPGRIDLGLGRAAGTDPYTARILNPSNDFKEENFPAKVEELQAFFADAAMSQRGPVMACPSIDTLPQQWILTGGANASVAARWGLGLSLPHFIQEVRSTEGVELYRREFSPSGTFPESRVSMGLFVICAETEEKSELLKKCIQIVFVGMALYGRFQPMPSVSEAKSHEFNQQEMAFLEMQKSKYVSGTPDRIREQLNTYADKFDLDEVIAMMMAYDFEDRMQSYDLLAHAYDLENRTVQKV